jgi:hypothetical protein
VSEHCPTCGATVRVVSGDEGTSHYEPLGTVEALAKEVAPMAEQLQGAVSALTEARALGERWVKHPEHNGYGAALLAVLDAYGGAAQSDAQSQTGSQA